MSLHTARTIAAANTISKLITLPTPLIKHTPFFTCFVALASIVHLSACSWLLSGDEAFLAKERIRLGVGALKVMESCWAVAETVAAQVGVVAREVFREQEEGVGEEVMRFLEEERGGDWVLGDMDWGGVTVDWDGV